ncbi:uncharacterized protein BJ212DRAFT_1575428 [Suillus subaureus]|uniref:Uncharacterized protein n=1 Tax=Suillus subaureus TaxID=48587 RepID=A0A9P7JFX8_9AGAM|nr:uncharacterized protein BJ212DRAFT_1575428 [Suillus subaureus]KAG1820143.1 hypothetical protein BJ212DRAFT_1575428 [Suillus subaureus]
MLAHDIFRSALIVRDAKTLSISEFLEHPDYHQIASFFLGWVFICSLLCIVTSPVMCHLYQMCCKAFDERRGLQPDANFRNEHGTLWNNSEKTPTDMLSWGDRNSSITSLEEENSALVLLLSFCFAFASVAHFSSLLSFNSNSGASACTFLVALGGIATSCAHFMGLIILNLDLRKFELWRWEIYLAWSWLFVAGGFVVATCVMSAGAVACVVSLLSAKILWAHHSCRYVLQLDTYLCYSTSYLPTALTMSAMFMTLELYMIGRLLSFIAPPFLEFRHRVGAVTDTRVLRALSLLLFDILNLVPGVKAIGIVGEFVPFSIGALVVLAMFQKHRRRPILGEPIPVPMSLRGSTICTIHVSMPPRHSGPTYTPGRPFTAPTDFATTQTYRTSIASSLSSSLYSYNTAARSCQTGTGASVVRVASRLKYTQSRPHLVDPAETYVSSHGRDGAAEEYTKTCSRPPSDAASAGHILPDQNDYANSSEYHQDPPTRGGLPIRPRMQIATSQPRQPPAALMSPLISPEPGVYGSDTIGASGSRDKVDVAKRPSQRSRRSTLPSNLSLLLPLESVPASVVHFHCNSTDTSVSSDEKSWGSEDQHDRWLAFGQSSLSPTRRRTFDDKSLQSFIPQTSPTEQSVTNIPRSSKLLTSSPLGEQSFNILSLTASQRSIRKLPSLKVQEEAEGDNSPVDPFTPAFAMYRRAPPASGMRIRGPRPPPKVFSQTLHRQQVPLVSLKVLALASDS